MSVLVRNISYAGLIRRETLNFSDKPPQIAAIEVLCIVIFFCYKVFQNHVSGTVTHYCKNHVTYLLGVKCTSNYYINAVKTNQLRGKYGDNQCKLTENVRHSARIHLEISSLIPILKTAIN